MMAAMRSIGLPVVFTMSSDITATVFAQISPHQNEIIIQPRGVRFPVVSSLKVLPSRSFEIKSSLACLLREEKIVLLCANTMEAAVSHGSDVEQMLMETVRLTRIYFWENMLTLNRSGAPVLGHPEPSRRVALWQGPLTSLARKRLHRWGAHPGEADWPQPISPDPKPHPLAWRRTEK